MNKGYENENILFFHLLIKDKELNIYKWCTHSKYR